jgi:hypothetical protein
MTNRQTGEEVLVAVDQDFGAEQAPMPHAREPAAWEPPLLGIRDLLSFPREKAPRWDVELLLYQAVYQDFLCGVPLRRTRSDRMLA